MKPTSRIKGQDRYLYRAVDSTGQTIDFLLPAKRGAAAAKRFFRKTLLDPANPQPRIANVDKNRAYPEMSSFVTLAPRWRGKVPALLLDRPLSLEKHTHAFIRVARSW